MVSGACARRSPQPAPVVPPPEVTAPAPAVKAVGVHPYGGICAVVGDALICQGSNEALTEEVEGGTRTRHVAGERAVLLESGVTALSAGTAAHQCAVQRGALKCWGNNKSGQLGDGTREDRLAPVQVVGLESGVSAVSVVDEDICAIQRGALKCWWIGV